MRHVGLNQMTGRESGVQAEFSSKDSSSNNTRQSSCVVTRIRLVGTPDTEQVEHGTLRFKDGSTTNGTDFDRRH